MSKAFQFVVKIDGVAVVTQGLAQEWALPPTFFITQTGLLTQGLVVGKGDFWQWADASSNAGWVEADI